MNGPRKSDDPILPEKQPNKAGGPGEEAVEGRGSAKGNTDDGNAFRTQSRGDAHSAIARVREAARKDRKLRFTSLLHHVYDIGRLRSAYLALRRDAAPGVDGMTWQDYGQDLEARLEDLSGRLRRMSYRTKPVLRVEIPKANGGTRPLGVAALEDKIVQRALVEVLNAIYEVDFLGFSHGFRPGRSAHYALDSLTTGIMIKRVSWVLDADISSFFDSLDWGWLEKFLEHRIADRRIIRLINKWLRAGVMVNGARRRSERGTVQGGSISPLLANVYLHYVFDLWAQHWRKNHARGDVVVVRYADDLAVGFEHRDEAEAFRSLLTGRFAKFGLKLHPEKTRLIRFGRRARRDGGGGRGGKPETFDFLGFTHICGVTRKGAFTVFRRTRRQTTQRKLAEVKEALRRKRHLPLPIQGQWLASVLRGHFRYFGVPMNSGAITRFRLAVVRLWRRSLARRSQRSRMTWERMNRIASRWLPPARICHPYPLKRLGVIT